MANILDFLGKPLSPHEESSFDPEGDGYDEEGLKLVSGCYIIGEA